MHVLEKRILAKDAAPPGHRAAQIAITHVLSEQCLEHVHEALAQLVSSRTHPVVVHPVKEVSPVEADGLLQTRDLIVRQRVGPVPRQVTGVTLERLDVGPHIAQKADEGAFDVETRIGSIVP